MFFLFIERKNKKALYLIFNDSLLFDLERYEFAKISTSVSKKLHYSNNNMYKCTTYYTSGQVRGCGLISNDDKMQGEWIFYHHNNEVESKHNFSDGKLIGKSFLFYENGKLYKEVNHD